ncbi:MAG: hypothetical protein ACLQO1_18565 [Steroidobacteraceae bacterium]
MHKFFLSLVASVFVCTVALATGAPSSKPVPPPVAEGTPPAGSVTFSGGSVALGVGYVWGHGTLDYDNNHYKFKLSGISVADVGGDIAVAGEVYKLVRLRDFNGKYSSVGVTGDAGESVRYLENKKGVVIKLHSTTKDLRFILSADGVHIKLQ